MICDDARAFQEEAERRVAATKAAVGRGEKPASGDRILVVGYDTDREKHAYAELPLEYLTGPGHAITPLDGDDVAGRVRGVHPRAVQGRLRRRPQRDLARDAGHAHATRQGPTASSCCSATSPTTRS